MTKQEYDNKMVEIQKEYSAAKKRLHVEYAFSHNTVKVGDIIKNDAGFLEVKEIKAYKGFGMPECVYYGTNLLKDGKTISKREPKGSVYQQHLKNE